MAVTYISARAEQANTSPRYIPAKEAAQMMRNALKCAFPAVRFAVRSSRHSGGSSIHITWTNGPAPSRIEAIVQDYTGSEFDSTIEATAHHTSWLMPDGSALTAYRAGTIGSRGTIPPIDNRRPCPDAELVQFGCDYVFCARHATETAVTAFRGAFAALPAQQRSQLMFATTDGVWDDMAIPGHMPDASLSAWGPQADDVFRAMLQRIDL